MSKSQPRNIKSREIKIASRHKSALEERSAAIKVNEADQIRTALESFSKIEPTNAHRALLALESEPHRKHIPIDDELWEQLKERKKRYGLLLEDQIEIALALYFGEAPAIGSDAATAPVEAPDVRQIVREELESLSNSFPAGAFNPLNAARVIQIGEPESPKVVQLRSFEAVPCGPWREVLAEAVEMNLPAEIAEVLGAREGDMIFPTRGQSMIKAGIPDKGRVVMRPLSGSKPPVGTIVLFCIERENGAWESTLKFFYGFGRNGQIELRDGSSRSVSLPADTVAVHPVAVLVGVMGPATMGTVKGVPLVEEVKPRSDNPFENLDSE